MTSAAASATGSQVSIHTPPTDSTAVAVVQRSAYDVAIEKLKQLDEFSGEILTAEKMRDPSLDVALTEISPKIFHKKKALSNEEVITLLRYCLALRTLNLSGFYRITQQVLPQVANLKMLITLNLSGTGVTDLKPLIESPLPHLTTVNFFQTKIPRDILMDFLRKHDKISDLTPPQNPPAGFFVRFRSDILKYVKLIIASHGKGTLDLPEITDFFRHAPNLINLCLTIDADTDFNTKDWSEPPKTRQLTLKSRNLKVGCELLGKNKAQPC